MLRLIASLALLIAHAACGEETVLLSFNDGVKSVPVSEARKRLLEIRRGDSVSNVFTRLGYPDEVEVKVQGQAYSSEGEWRRWRYGATAPHELPLIGAIEIDTNLTVLGVMKSFLTWPEEPRTNAVGTETNIICTIERIWRDPEGRTPELSYLASISITNAGKDVFETDIETRLSESWRQWQWEIYNSSNTLVFASRPYPVWSSSPDKNANMIKLPPGRTKDRDAVGMLLGGSDLGIP
ncbi:MAG TPA: hypothetical protein VFZ59_04840 [Verrucomicrobiae bacterium]|nr:hypothetical protein [Verrucomicrobiae bacterium]